MKQVFLFKLYDSILHNIMEQNLDKDKIISEFNKYIMQLMSKLEQMYKNNGDIDTLKRRIRIAKNEDNKIIIEHVGPRLYKYREKILKREESFFTTRENIDEINKIDEKDENKQMVLNLFSLIRDGYSTLDKSEQDEMYNKIINMLKFYLKYMMITKK